MPHISIILISLLLGLASFNSAFAEDVGDARIARLCGTESVEGRYVVTMEEHAPIFIYLLCTGLDRIAATWINRTQQGTFSISLPNAAVDGDQLALTSFSLAYDDASDLASNHTPGIRVELSVESLRAGILEGEYKTALNRVPLHVHGKRDQTFPNLLALEHGSKAVHGTYRVDDLGALRGMRGPVFVDVDLINGIDRVTLVDSGSVFVTLFLGMLAEGHGDVFYAGSGIGDTDDSVMPFMQIRGHPLSENQIEFYFFSTLYGMSGPISATRIVHHVPHVNDLMNR